jgi:hypothetical protein
MNGAASSRSPAALLRRGPLAGRAQQPAMPGFLNAVHPSEWVALNNINETGSLRWAGSSRGGRRSQAKLWVAVGIAIAVVATAWLAYSYRQSYAAASAPAALPQVVVSKPLEREVDSRLGFLGQFSAVEQVELRAQVGGTLTGIHFKDGDIVHQGDLLFTIDPRPYEIRLAQAKAQLETANARLVLAGRELHRAEVLVLIERDRGQFVPSRRRRMMANVRAERLLKTPAEPSPELRIPALQLKREWSPWPQFGSDPGNPRELSKG